MRLIVWQEEFSTGDADVDLEHQELVESINTMYRSMSEGVTRKQVMDALNSIYAQIAEHFAHEETLMRESHYRLYAEHKTDHEILLDDLRDIMDEVDADGGFEESQLSIDLNRWFSDHFHTHDAKLHSHTGHH
jgi:hemerythrin